jgi:purine nucleosidase
VHVAVEQNSELTLGATPVDWWEVTGKAANVNYLTTVDSDGFFRLLADNLSTLP